MDGMHDLGGRQGFGRGPPLAARPRLSTSRGRSGSTRCYSLAVKLGIFNMDEYRHAIERMEPRHYLSASYYERSLTSLATLCVEKGIVTREELERRAQGAFPLSRRARPAAPTWPSASASSRATRSRVRTDHIPGHVRMPGYIRGKTGVVVGESPAYPFPDAHAHGVKAEDEPTYDVRFRAEDLWPNGADPALVHVGVFQSYLERVS